MFWQKAKNGCRRKKFLLKKGRIVLFLREIDMNSPGKCTSVVEQKFDFRSFRPGTELISGKPQGSVSVISGLEEAGNATTGEQKAYCYFTAVLW